jgi:SWI/SNF-related matrix-associated actin-dependent regulator 1 of chromatin subfamily A
MAFFLIRYGIDKNGRCLIADDMGLGKTFQALAIANYYSSDWPLLVVTTSSMKY